MIIVINTAPPDYKRLFLGKRMYIIWTPSTLPLGHRDILFSKLNYLLDNKIYTKNKLQFSCSLFICGGAFFCKNSQCVEFVGYFRGRAPPWKFDRTLNSALPNNSLQHEESLRRSFPPLTLYKGISDFHCFLILLVYTKTTRWKLALTPRPHLLE